jgi:hypothetical protein
MSHHRVAQIGMMTMAGRAFVDTYVLLRAIAANIADHRAAESLIQRMWESGTELWISRQVIR